MANEANVADATVVVQATALTRQFGDLTAVDKVTLSVGRGEIFGMIGPNGAGKSTLIKMLTTLLPPTSGTATISGYDIVAQPGAVRRQIGYVPQQLSADGSLTGTWCTVPPSKVRLRTGLCQPISTKSAPLTSATPTMSFAGSLETKETGLTRTLSSRALVISGSRA